MYHWNMSQLWDEFLFFDFLTVDFSTIYKFKVSKKLYLFVCRFTNGIKVTLLF